MAKNSVRDYSATNADNTDIQSIDISEGCSPAGINNAVREVMVDLKNVSTGAVALESPAFDSASLTGDLTFGDNDKAVFGAGSDLQIYHDGSHSYIEDVGTGELRLRGNGSVKINQYNNNEAMAIFNVNGSVDLRYDNSTKLETTASGISVFGTVTADVDIKTDKLSGVGTAGSILVTGEGNSTTTNLQQGLAKCWVNFDGTASGAAARDSFNVSGMTDNGIGDYTVTYSSALGNANYSTPSSAYNRFVGVTSAARQTASACRLDCITISANTDYSVINVAMLGDLA